MQADGDLHQPLIKDIPPFIVGQFMQDDILKIFFRNVRTGQDNAGTEKANQQRGRNQWIDTKFNRFFYG